MLHEVVQEYPVLTADLLKLYYWAQKYYAATPEAMLEAMIPTAIRRGMKTKKAAVCSHGSNAHSGAMVCLGEACTQTGRTITLCSATDLCASARTLLKRMDISASACDALVKNYLIETETEEAREAYSDDLAQLETIASDTRPTLTSEQALVVDNLHAAILADKFAVRLLHGVTGSGKTEVYLHAVEKRCRKKRRGDFLSARSSIGAADCWSSTRSLRSAECAQ